jgi:hypothetical protein
MPYRIAGIDVHKRMLAVAIADVEVVGEFAFERRQFGSAPAQLRLLGEHAIEWGAQAAQDPSTGLKPVCQDRNACSSVSFSTATRTVKKMVSIANRRFESS